MKLELLTSPVSFLRHCLGDDLPTRDPQSLDAYERWWERDGKPISTAVDRAGTPWVQQYDRLGARVDDVIMPAGYRPMLEQGYQHGVVWRAFDESPRAAYLFGYVAAYYDTGLYCPYTVSLATAASVDKYAEPVVRDQLLPHLLRRDDSVWQGATWMTEARGGSDLGAAVETTAKQVGDGWRLSGDKYFSSNAGAELAVVAARPDNAPAGVRGLALFLVPRLRADGSLNYHIRRMKDKIATRSVPTGEVELRDSEAWLLGEAGHGIYLILEVLNLSRVCNSIGSVALAQRALADAYTFASERLVFGKRLIDQPLMRRQFEQRWAALEQGMALAWEAVLLMEAIWRERAPRYSESFHLFRLVTHLAKYWTAEAAVQAAKWAMEVNGGMGTLAEFGVERWLREAMIVDIWEGPPHRQILDGLEAIERKDAARLLFEHLSPYADPAASAEIAARVGDLLTLPQDEKEANAGDLFEALADFTGAALTEKLRRRVPAQP